MVAMAIRSEASGKHRFIIRTPLPVEACKRRLTTALEETRREYPTRFPIAEGRREGAARFMAILRQARGQEGDGPRVRLIIGGRVTRQRVTLWLTRQVDRVPFTDSFSPRLIADLIEDGSGTKVEGQFRMLRFVQVFLAVWSAGFLGGFAAIIYLLLTGAERHGSIWLLLLGPPALLVVLFGSFSFFRWIARGDKARMLSFIEQTLEGPKPAERGEGA
jgi:hypothetical protein